MNERIRELWNQAAREDSSDTWDSQTQFIERFAQLIVGECIAHVGEFTGEHHAEEVVFADGTRGLTYTIVSAEEVLRKHFGFE